MSKFGESQKIRGTQEKRILRKVAWRITPFLLLGFFISYIDRANLSVLYQPLSNDLQLSAASFGLAAGLFYVGYLLFEIPSNMAMVRYGARIWIARIMFSWGIVTVMIAAVKGERSLCLLRLLLGAVEAGFYPGVIFYLTKWIPKRKLSNVYALLVLMGPVSLAIGSTVTSSLLLLDGVAGLKGWQWVCILEGVPAIILAIAIFVFLPNSPTDARWLTLDEKSYLNETVRSGEERSSHSLREFRHVLRNPWSWFLSALYFLMLIGFWAVLYFLPQITQERLQVSPTSAGYISAIPWVISTLVIWIVGRSSTLSNERCWHMLFCLVMGAAGLCLAAYSHRPWVAMFGVCLGAAGVTAPVSLFWSMTTKAFSGPTSAIAIALINSIGNTSGLAGPVMLGAFSSHTGDSRAGLFALSCLVLAAAFLAFSLCRRIERKESIERSPLKSSAEYMN